MKSKKTNRLQNYELSELRSLLYGLSNRTDFEFINFSRIYTGEAFKYPTNEQEADIFIKDRIRLYIQSNSQTIDKVSKILFTDFDCLA